MKVPVPVTCLGGHETYEWPCYVANPTSCERECGRMLMCGNHTCSLPCHTVEGAPNEVAVSKPCVIQNLSLDSCVIVFLIYKQEKGVLWWTSYTFPSVFLEILHTFVIGAYYCRCKIFHCTVKSYFSMWSISIHDIKKCQKMDRTTVTQQLFV